MDDKYKNVKLAEQYARDVVSGKIPACKWVKLSCERHISDKKKSKKKTYLYRFDKDKAQRACSFAEGLPHVKGKWAGQRIVLEPWQCFIFCMLFGWLHKLSGLRRFRRADIMIPRKNGKSIIAAIIGLYMLVADGEIGAEVYCGAVSQDQAYEVFTPAKLMVSRTPDFQRELGVSVHKKSITQLHTGSSFKPLIGKPGDGSSPSCAIHDEYHEHADDDQVNTMHTGMGAREQPLQLKITTAGDNLSGPCHLEFDDAKKVLQGIIEDDQLFVIIYTVDKEDKWNSLESLYKANPNLGVSVNEEALIADQKIAEQTPRKQAAFKTKRLNIWVGALDAFFDIDKYDLCADTSLKIEDFAGMDCRLALDLASKVDLNALDILFEPEPERYVSFTKYFLPDAMVNAPGKDHYKGWTEEEWMIATEGEIIDFSFIKAAISGFMTQFNVLEVGYDPWQATQLATEMMLDGAPMVEYHQTLRNMTEPTKHLDAMIRAGQYKHDGNPISKWCMSNVVVYTDPNDNVKPKKAREENKIDGAIAKIMNMGLSIGSEVQGPSVYEDRGIRSL